MNPIPRRTRTSINSKGFSLVESLAVIVILFLMTWIIVPGLFKKTPAQKAEEAYLEKMKTKREAKPMEVGPAPVDLPQPKLPAPTVFSAEDEPESSGSGEGETPDTSSDPTPTNPSVIPTNPPLGS